MTDIPGMMVPADADLDEMLDEVGNFEPLISFPSGEQPDEADWAGAIDALIAAGLMQP
jgi:hypothetical protein